MTQRAERGSGPSREMDRLIDFFCESESGAEIDRLFDAFGPIFDANQDPFEGLNLPEDWNE